jgi:hypothetical protein
VIVAPDGARYQRQRLRDASECLARKDLGLPLAASTVGDEHATPTASVTTMTPACRIVLEIRKSRPIGTSGIVPTMISQRRRRSDP